MAVVLLYHRVNATTSDPWALNVSPRNFAEQLAVLQRCCRLLSLTDLVRNIGAGQSGAGQVAVTFDDGYADNLYSALPVLERFEVPATFFVPSGHVGSSDELWWDELDRLLLQPGHLPRLLTLDIEGKPFQWDLAEASSYSGQESVQHAGWVAWEPPPTLRHALYVALWAR